MNHFRPIILSYRVLTRAMNPSKARAVLMACSLFLLCACSSTPWRESTGQYFDSSAVTMKVKTRLIDMLGAKNAMSIKVKTYKGDVQLSGFVNNALIKQRAGIITDNTMGVVSVRNDLIVK